MSLERAVALALKLFGMAERNLIKGSAAYDGTTITFLMVDLDEDVLTRGARSWMQAASVVAEVDEPSGESEDDDEDDDDDDEDDDDDDDDDDEEEEETEEEDYREAIAVVHIHTLLPPFMHGKASLKTAFARWPGLRELSTRREAWTAVRKFLRDTALCTTVLAIDRVAHVIGTFIPDGSLKGAAIALNSPAVSHACLHMPEAEARAYVMERVRLRVPQWSATEIAERALEFPGTEEFLDTAFAHPFSPHVGVDCAVDGVVKLITLDGA